MNFTDETVQRGVDPSMRRFFGGSHQQAVVTDVGAENSREFDGLFFGARLPQ